ncbi:hypothetical protein IGI37_001002 [Enterococcus sp. AZ194]|uniref:hypothetical protein n=1 Tax=Enterococcus sp. AZ194 TaxID=2774629 RepID=UPI003F246E76
MKKNNNKICIVIFSFFTVLVIIVNLSRIIYQQEETLELTEAELDIAKINSDSLQNFEFASPNMLNNIVKKNEIVFTYIGNNECLDCSTFYPIFKNVVMKNKIENKILYVEGSYLRKDKEKWLDFKNINQFSQTPAFIIYKDGKVIDKIEWDSDEGLTEKDFSVWISENLSTIKLIKY